MELRDLRFFCLTAEMDYVFERKEQTITLMCNIESFATRLILAFRDSNPQYGLSVLNASIEEMQDALITGSAIITELIVEDYPELKQYCVEMDIPENCGYYGLSYNKLAFQNRNVAHFLEFAIKFFADLQG